MTPGVLLDVPLDSEIAQEEVFGPVAMVFKAKDLDEAIALANHVPYGLGSAVWTQDDAEIERFARDVEAGNDRRSTRCSPRLPRRRSAGVKRSGHGRELGPWGLHEFMNLKAVMYGAGTPGD
ncbi:MAG: aldehyde dehydrogenase family protein [Sphingomonas sp.]